MPGFPSASLFVGDLYLLEDRVSGFIAELRAQMKGEVSVQSFKLTETPLDRIIASARSLPFLTDFQIFRIQEVQALKEKKLESLSAYLSEPSAAAALIFESSALDRDHALVKLLLSRKADIQYLEDAGKKSAGSKLVREKLRKAGKKLAPGVLDRLEDQAGDAPAFIDSVLDQLILYSAGAEEITEEMAEQFQENWKEPNAFALTDALFSGRRKDALVCLRQMLEQDENEIIPMIGLLHWQVRRFWQAKVLTEDGLSQSEVLKKCKINPRQAPFFTRQLQGVSRKKLEQTLENLFQLDWALKSGRSEGALDLERWVIRTV